MTKKKDGEVVDFAAEKERIQNLIENSENNEPSLEDILSDPNDPKLKEMNDKHAFINSVGGRPMVMCSIYSAAANRHVIEFRSPESIAVQYSNQTVQVDRSYMELGKWWIKNSNRREYDSVIFDPSKEREAHGCYNLWEGITVEPKKGSWRRALKHLYTILCNRNADKFKYTVRWFAWLIQNPGDRAEVAIIFKGKEGAGKGFIFAQFLKIYGQHGITIANRKHLTGQFNGHLKQVVFLFADEAYYPGDKDVEGTLKQLITEEQIPIEEKYKTLGPSKNCLHIGMSTNQEWVIPATEDARRYFINEVDNRYAKNQIEDSIRDAYFTPLWEEMSNGGREAMVYDLQRMPLNDWHPRKNVPITEEMEKQRALSLPKLHKIYLTFLEEGVFPGELTKIDLEYLVSSKSLYEYFDEIDPESRKFSVRTKGDFIRKLGAVKTRRASGNYWILPELNIIRHNWDKMFGNNPWEEPNAWTVRQIGF